VRRVCAFGGHIRGRSKTQNLKPGERTDGLTHILINQPGCSVILAGDLLTGTAQQAGRPRSPL
jgi:hypothetical protein